MKSESFDEGFNQHRILYEDVWSGDMYCVGMIQAQGKSSASPRWRQGEVDSQMEQIGWHNVGRYYICRIEA